jgi:hypothetical protein
VKREEKLEALEKLLFEFLHECEKASDLALNFFPQFYFHSAYLSTMGE